MPVEVTELFLSREIDRGKDTMTIVDIYSIEGVGDPRAAEAYGPSFDDTTDQDGVTLQVQRKKAVRIASDACRLTVTFGVPGSTSGGGVSGESWEMDLTAGTEHISAVEKVEDQTHYPSSQDVGMVIGLTPDGRAEGVDKYVPKATLNVTKYWNTSAITSIYLNRIYNLTGTVNGAVFKGWQPGDLLFLGARARSAQSGLVPVVYTFIGSSHVDALKIDTIVDAAAVEQTIAKEGWEYLWFDHTVYDAEINGKTVKKEGVKGVHVAKIYRVGNFDFLELNREL